MMRARSAAESRWSARRPFVTARFVVVLVIWTQYQFYWAARRHLQGLCGWRYQSHIGTDTYDLLADLLATDFTYFFLSCSPVCLSKQASIFIFLKIFIHKHNK